MCSSDLELAATYRENRDLIAVGAYRRGQDARLDRVIDIQPDLEAFLSQSMDQPADMASSIDALVDLLHSA